jgi:hypothetical protein
MPSENTSLKIATCSEAVMSYILIIHRRTNAVFGFYDDF